MRKLLLGFAVLALAVTGAMAQAGPFVDLDRVRSIDPAKGADAAVDYAAMTLLGPWDDRNYQLTREDLAALSPDEMDLTDTVPVFFRVGMRKAWPELPRTGEAQYPRSALQIFRQMFGGYLVDGKLYRKATRIGQRFYVELDGGLDQKAFSAGADFASGEVRITSPTGAAESAIKISPVDTAKVVAGSNGPGGGQKMHYSTDGGDSWTQVDLPLGGTCCDPAVDWSSNGQYAYAVALGSCGFQGCPVWFYRSDDFGVSWNGLESVTPGDPRREVSTGGSDKEFMHVDQYAGSPYTDRIYLTWHNGNIMQFAWSGDFGNTWNKQAFASSGTDNGIGSDITTDANGNVYYIWAATGSKTIRMKKSTDGGVNFGASVTVANTQASFIFRLPSIETREAFVYAAADSDLSGGPYHGSVYAAWTDNTGPDSSTPSLNHGRIQVAYSRDVGASWNVTTPHETADANTVDRWHPWISVAPDGGVHVMYYDTRQDPTRTSVDVYYSFSDDGAQTWAAPVRVTTAMSPNISDGFEFGDYNGMDMVMNDLIAIFTDNRNEGGGSGDSVDVYGAGITPGSVSTCGNNITEPGEVCDGTDLGTATCDTLNCDPGGALACNITCDGFDKSGCSNCISCDNDGLCELGEDCNNCPGDCAGGSTSGATCGNGVCEAGNGEDCVSCPADCNGVTGGKPSNRYCCGDTTPCSDSRCTTGGNSCTTVPVTPGSFCCGTGGCEDGESCGNCALDCSSGPEICDNGIDDDCANGTDCSDSSCMSAPACQTPSCQDPGAACTSNADCCSNRCKGKGGSKTCQ